MAIQTFTEDVETDKHTWKVCDGCGRVIEEKVTSLVVKEFSEVLGLYNKDGEYGRWVDGQWKPAFKKEIQQATRVYKVGDQYQWFGYSEGGKHVCK